MTSSPSRNILQVLNPGNHASATLLHAWKKSCPKLLKVNKGYTRARGPARCPTSPCARLRLARTSSCFVLPQFFLFALQQIPPHPKEAKHEAAVSAAIGPSPHILGPLVRQPTVQSAQSVQLA